MKHTRTTTVIGFMLAERVKFADKTMADLGNALRLSPNQLATRIKGKVRFKDYELQNVLGFFNLPHHRYLDELGYIVNVFNMNDVYINNDLTTAQDFLAKAHGSKMLRAKVAKTYQAYLINTCGIRA